jgi:hypothetical protein
MASIPDSEGEFDPDEFLPLAHEALKDVWDAPGMEAYEPSPERHQEAAGELQLMIDQMHANVRASGRSSAELERVIDEECDAVRYGK